MKILFLSTVYPHPTAPVRGTYNRELCRAMNSIADVRVISPIPWTNRITSPFGQNEGDDFNGDGIPVSYPTYFYTPKVMRNSYGEFMWKSIRRHVERITSDFKPDWVLSYWAHPDGEAGMRAAESLGAKSGVIVGGSDILLLTKDPTRRKKVTDVLNNSDAVFPVARSLHRRAVVLGTLPANVHTIYQGIDTNTFRSGFRGIARQALGLTTGERMFLWVGRMVDVKRLDRLVEAFAKVRKIEPSVKLALVGDGPLRKNIVRLVEQTGLQKNVLMPGGVGSQELANWYRAADATVLSSDSEGLPNVFRESLACGTPFVSTDVGSVQELADPAYSIVVPVDDTEALKQGMVDILHPDFQKNAEHFQPRTWGDCARDFVAVMSGQSIVPLADSQHQTLSDGTVAPADTVEADTVETIAAVSVTGATSVAGPASTIAEEWAVPENDVDLNPG